MYKNLIKQIFSVQRRDAYKVLTILGMQIHFPLSRYKVYPSRLALYDKERHRKLRKTRHNAVVSDTLAHTVAFSTLHKLKEIECKAKVKEGKKIRVCFFFDEISRWSSKSVYEAMCTHPLFEPFLVLYQASDGDLHDDRRWEDYCKYYTFLQEKGYPVYSGYDSKRKYIPLENYMPDIIFISAPYFSAASSCLSLEYLTLNYLVCYVNYGLNTVNLYEYHYDNRHIYTTWKHFVDTREDYEEIMRYSPSCGSNAVLTGFPKLDAYTEPVEQYQVPHKIDNGNPIVIYAPHWSVNMEIETSDMSTFHIYADYFLHLVKEYPHISFIFKPHPNLRSRVVSQGIMTAQEYDAYIDEWDSQSNGLYIFDGEYIGLFKRSSLLITDSGSFIGEWLPSGNPCMYLVTPQRNPQRYMLGFSLMGRKILEQYYLCYTKEDIARYFSMIMEEGKDEKKEARKQLKDELFINIGSAGSTIVEYLNAVLTR